MLPLGNILKKAEEWEVWGSLLDAVVTSWISRAQWMDGWMILFLFYISYLQIQLVSECFPSSHVNFFFFFFGLSKLVATIVPVSTTHLAAVKAVSWTVVRNKQLGWSVTKRQVFSRWMLELLVCCVKGIWPTTARWKSCELKQWGLRRLKMSEVFNAARCMEDNRWQQLNKSRALLVWTTLDLKAVEYVWSHDILSKITV